MRWSKPFCRHPASTTDSRGMALRDYEEWLTRYDDSESPVSWRLALVQRWLRAELDRRDGPLAAVSACAGNGRDIIDVLAERRDAGRVSGASPFTFWR